MICNHCRAPLTLPEDPLALRVQCSFCGAEQALPNVDRLAVARERERQRRDAARDSAERAREQEDRAERKREARASRRGWAAHRLWIGAVSLLGPGIVAWQVGDIPGRFLGPTGRERVDPIAAELTQAGCTPLVPPITLYSNNQPVVQVVTVEADACVEVVAAGSPAQARLKGAVYDSRGHEVASAPATTDVRMSYCPGGRGTCRYELTPGLLDKGRLTHGAWQCPRAGAPKKQRR
jgi:LSD1 subclass zinc finger protein